MLWAAEKTKENKSSDQALRGGPMCSALTRRQLVCLLHVLPIPALGSTSVAPNPKVSSQNTKPPSFFQLVLFGAELEKVTVLPFTTDSLLRSGTPFTEQYQLHFGICPGTLSRFGSSQVCTLLIYKKC